ncbi:hypothetical protein LPN04_05690 [Rugamonas sp. A1-17]|nr:hypothetical protein [Rugamonas sp. A1-17]
MASDFLPQLPRALQGQRQRDGIVIKHQYPRQGLALAVLGIEDIQHYLAALLFKTGGRTPHHLETATGGLLFVHMWAGVLSQR